ncbi:radical SAM protein [Psychrobacter sp. P11G5]|nr:radical SAM protein [Psychrobacter sp. P11G5]
MLNKLDTILIKVASRCNLDCSYCYVYNGQDTSWMDQPKLISTETVNNLCRELSIVSNRQPSGFAIVLHGGEPFLLGEVKLSNLLAHLRDVLPNHEQYPIAIQTNAILLNNKILDICHKYRVSVSASVDGIREANDIGRFTHKGKSSFDKTVDGIKLLVSHDQSDFLFSGTLSVIQPTTNPIDNYNYLKRLGSKSIDILLQDGNHTFLPAGKASFNSTEYGDWLVELFQYYVNDPDPVPIRFFDDIIKIALGGNPEKEGKGEQGFGIIVIETDGEIRKNDTLRATFEGVDYFDGRPNIKSEYSLFNVLKSKEFAEASSVQHPTSKECQACEIGHICGGGMPLSRWSQEKGFDNPSIYCKDHKLYIGKMLETLRRYAL